MSSDQMRNLPVNRQNPDPHDVKVMEAVFGNTTTTPPSTTTKLLISGISFFILGLPVADTILKKFIDTSPMILLMIKTGIFVAIILMAQLLGWM